MRAGAQSESWFALEHGQFVSRKGSRTQRALRIVSPCGFLWARGPPPKLVEHGSRSIGFPQWSRLRCGATRQMRETRSPVVDCRTATSNNALLRARTLPLGLTHHQHGSDRPNLIEYKPHDHQRQDLCRLAGRVRARCSRGSARRCQRYGEKENANSGARISESTTSSAPRSMNVMPP